MATPQAARIHRFTVDDVSAMAAAGIFGETERLELVDGVLVEMSRPSPRHSAVVRWLTKHFVIAAGDAHEVSVQDAFITGEYGYLLPDLMVFESIARDRQPETALLAVEVSYTSRARDTQKAADFARAGVTEYWIVDIDRDEMLVHRSPANDAYTSIERFVPGDSVTALVGGPPVDVAALLAY